MTVASLDEFVSLFLSETKTGVSSSSYIYIYIYSVGKPSMKQIRNVFCCNPDVGQEEFMPQESVPPALHEGLKFANLVLMDKHPAPVGIGGVS